MYQLIFIILFFLSDNISLYGNVQLAINLLVLKKSSFELPALLLFHWVGNGLYFMKWNKKFS